MHSDSTPNHTPISNRLCPQFSYKRTPTAIMPMPTIPERILSPEPGIHEVFYVRIATDDQAENTAFEVRWEVYCRELGFEPPDKFPDKREHDIADLRSVQVIVYHRATSRPVGCYRLMLANPSELNAPFHVEEVCPHLIPGAIPATGDKRLGYAELSRFCIVSPFRCFDTTTDTPPWGISPNQWSSEARHRRGLAGLMWLTAAHIAWSLRLDYLLTLMEPRLHVLGRAMGFDFMAVGGPVEFRGQRVPYRIDRRSLRTLLLVPQTANLLNPLLASIERDIQSHPLLSPYLSNRTNRIQR